MSARSTRARMLGLVLAACLVAAIAYVASPAAGNRIHASGSFTNSTGVFVGDEVRILGVPVGKIDSIRADGDHVRIGFWYDDKYRVPADADAVIISPALVTSRALQLTPAYTGGAIMAEGAVIPHERTAVPVEWDDFRQQLDKLTQTLQPTEPRGVSTLGSFVNTAANNLRGQGAEIHRTIKELGQAFSILGDHSGDLFGTVKNVSILVAALRDSADILRQLNTNLAAVSSLFTNDDGELRQAVESVNAVVGDVHTFVANNRETLGVTSDKLASVSTALVQSLDDIKQVLHVAPNSFQNFINIYQPAQATLTGALAINNFANPVSFLCGAIQAASRLNNQSSAKLCAQYLAPIIKNRQYNFPPIGVNPFVGTSARPNELTYSEDWLRPDYVPPAPPPDAAATPSEAPASPPPLAAESAPTDPAAGLPGMMVPPGGTR